MRTKLCFTILAIAIVGLFMGVSLAGEKMKGRTVKHHVKWEGVDVGDKEGHVVGVYENKGIQTVLAGRRSADGAILREIGILDLDTKAPSGSGSGYGDLTDRDGDKYYFTWKGKMTAPGRWEGTLAIVKGTGKYEGIRGNGTYVNYIAVPGEMYVDWEVELE